VRAAIGLYCGNLRSRLLAYRTGQRADFGGIRRNWWGFSRSQRALNSTPDSAVYGSPHMQPRGVRRLTESASSHDRTSIDLSSHVSSGKPRIRPVYRWLQAPTFDQRIGFCAHLRGRLCSSVDRSGTVLLLYRTSACGIRCRVPPDDRPLVGILNPDASQS